MNLAELRKNLIEPRAEGEDSKRREFILNIILIASIILLLWSEIYLVYSKITEGSKNKGVSLTLFSLLVFVFLLLYIASRQGYAEYSAYALIVIYFASISYAAYIYGPNLPAALLAYAMVIVMASILINTGSGFVATLMATAVIMILGYRESILDILPDLHWKNKTFMLSDGIEYSIMLGVIMTVSWLSNREIERSLKRARKSEADLTVERNLLEVKVEERTKELREVQLQRMSELAHLAEVGRLASGMVHDLLNPLTAISLNISELDRANEATVPANKYLRSVIQSTRRMEDLIDAIRTRMSRREVREMFSPTEEIMRAIKILSYKAKQVSVAIEFNQQASLKIYGSPVKFHEMVGNLVSNAIDAYESSLNLKESKRVEVCLFCERDLLIISVRDWGMGISPQDMNKIFDPFFTTKEVRRGTGLGLATVKSAVEDVFGGEISVRSELGNGSLFMLKIPLK